MEGIAPYPLSGGGADCQRVLAVRALSVTPSTVTAVLQRFHLTATGGGNPKQTNSPVGVVLRALIGRQVSSITLTTANHITKSTPDHGRVFLYMLQYFTSVGEPANPFSIILCIHAFLAGKGRGRYNLNKESSKS